MARIGSADCAAKQCFLAVCPFAWSSTPPKLRLVGLFEARNRLKRGLITPALAD